jgi:hypothetical protein
MDELSISTFRNILITWERWLRPAYNIVLAAVSVLVILNFLRSEYPVPPIGSALFHFGTRAVLANILFTAGPVADCYLTLLFGRRLSIVTGIIFAAGLLFSVLFVPISISWFWTVRFPGMIQFD